MGKLDFTDLSPEVARRIIVFLNCAKTAADIAGVEHQTGPIIDDPTTGPGDQVRDYDIGEIVAGRILERRAAMPGDRFTDIMQIDFIDGLGQDKLDDLAYSFGETFYGACRQIYLRIETIDEYSPVEPQVEKVMAPVKYRRDCIRNPGHENGTIPDKEVTARTITALVYREYEDANYLIPRTDKLINADVNEPIYHRRVPGAVIYAHPGEKLCINVFNADTMPHSFHVHGVEYGPDSDGAYPLGTQNQDQLRSDEICPGQSWTYVFDVKDEHVGCWPFHDHYRHASASIQRGLFGGLVVLPPGQEPPKTLPKKFIIPRNKIADLADFFPRRVAFRGGLRNTLHYRNFLENLNEIVIGDLVRPTLDEKIHHVPVFFHVMDSDEGSAAFDSGELIDHIGVFEHLFDEEKINSYFCRLHPEMTGSVNVVPGAPLTATVNIVDVPEMGFAPPVIDVGVGGTVRWENHSDLHHTVTEDGAVMPSHSINGRAFVGNSPTIEVDTGDMIRWYVFNLDLGHNFHNFHPHNIRWEFAGENLDVRVLSPAESFCIEAEAPSVVLMNPKIEAMQDPDKRPKNATEYTFVGDFLFHCHVHHHFMAGMAGLVRARHKLWLTPEVACELQEERGIRLYKGDNLCPAVDIDRCIKSGEGEWQTVPGDPKVAMMHACLLPNSSKVLYFGYESRYIPNEVDYSWLWDETTGYHMTNNQLDSLTPGGYRKWSLWSGEHTFLDDAVGTILIHGGYRDDVKKAYTFDPDQELWATAPASQYGRFYSTTITLANGKALTLFGSNLNHGGGTSRNIEVFDPAGGGSWEPEIPFPTAFDNHVYYPWTFLLPDGKLFIAGPHVPTHRFGYNDPTVYESILTNKGNRSGGGEKGTAVMFTLRPPNYEPKVMIIGGDTATTEQTSEIIDLSQPTPSWQYGQELDLRIIRKWQCHSVLLPDGRIFLCGGIESGPHGGASEIFDPENQSDGWQIGPAMKHYRTYHSAAILLADGSVLVGGDDPKPGTTEPTPHERYLPDYFTAPRPLITDAAVTTTWNTPIDIETPQALIIGEVAILRPGAVTHGWNMSQRRIELEITGVAGNIVTVQTPPNGNIAPPGWYLLFILDGNLVPSVGRWIRITAP